MVGRTWLLTLWTGSEGEEEEEAGPHISFKDTPSRIARSPIRPHLHEHQAGGQTLNAGALGGLPDSNRSTSGVHTLET